MHIELPPNFSVVVPIVAGVGNALMALPMVRQLKTRANAARVTIVARIDAMAEPFRRVAEVDEVVIARGSKSLVAALRAAQADLFLAPFPSNRWQYSMLAAASGARHALLHDYPVGKLSAMHFLGTRVPAVRGIHDVEQNLRLLRAIGVEPDLHESPQFVVRDEDRARALDVSGGCITNRYVVLHAGSAKTVLAKAKRWRNDWYVELINKIHYLTQQHVIVLEGPDEEGVLNKLAPAMLDGPDWRHGVRLSGNLGTAAAILERASFYVGSDSGLAHLAAAVGTRAITIFAPADPDRVCPYGNRDLVAKPNKACSPCFLYPWQATKPKMCCGQDGKPLCINEVTVEQVMEKVRAVFPLPPGEGTARAGAERASG